LAGAPAYAQVSQNDMQIVGRVLSFLEKPLTGEVVVGIVYAADNAQSLREAENVAQLLGGGLKVGSVTLKPLLVPIANITHVNAGMFFLTPGLGLQAKGIAEATRSKHVPCITTDITQVREGVCTVSVRSQPKIEILVNRMAAKDSGTAFSTVFRMMIKEI